MSSDSASAFRRDPVSGRWVIIAPERSRRPDEFRRPNPEGTESAAGPCPFCVGNESETPPEVYALREPGTAADAPGWKVRVVPNKFPAVARGGTAEHPTRGLFEMRDGVGAHEVVIDSPDHDRELADLSLAHVGDVLETYRRRLRSLEAEPGVSYVQFFKNKGREAGATLRHPHSQIVALPLLPKKLLEEIGSGERFWRETGDCLFCRIMDEELEAGERIVAENDHFAAFVPFAARFPYELRLQPRRHGTLFSAIGGDEIASLAEILAGVLGKLKAFLGDPPTNLVLHQGPASAAAAKSWPDFGSFVHWSFEIIPVTTRVAGFEWGTGFHINPVLPEAAARRLRGQP